METDRAPDTASADCAIKARWVLPMEPAGAVLEDHAVLVRAGKIVALLPSSEVDAGRVDTIVERPDHALLPGLVNAHTHAAMSLLRNAGGNLPLDAWLRQRIWPLEARLVNEQFVVDGAELAIAEMLLGGITCFADMYYHPDAAARVAAQAGLRVALGTDGAASNDSLDLLGEARLAALLAAGTSGNAAAIQPLQALEMATLEGARALGLGDRISSIRPGKWADLACLRLDGPTIEPCNDVAAALLHSAGRAAVTDTWVAGRRLVADGRLTRLNPQELRQRARDWRGRIVAAQAAIAGQ